MPDAQELLERERAARAAVERFAGRLMQLQSVTAALAEALTLDQVTAVIMGRVRDLLAASTCTVRLIDPAANTLDDVSSVGMPSGTREQYRSIPLSTPVPVVQAATEGRSFFFESLDALLADYPQLAEGVQRLGLQSFVVLPLSLQNQPLGSLSLTFEEPRNFEPEDRALLGSVASQCAQAIERARLYAKAQEAVRVRDSFIAIASHDLRGPITVLLGQAELLARRAEGAGVEPRLLTSAQTIAQQATRLERMIASLLDFSQIAAGQLTLALAPLDLHDLLRRLAEGLQPTLTQHTLALDADGPAPLLGDEVRLEQVFYNLIGNAVKYSPAGGTIRLRLWRERGQHCVEVSDEGLGIPADALPYLFDQFYRAPNVASGTIVGMGLGLYLVREIVDRHGGQVSASSVEGRGSTFTVLLPAE
jgi:signal transduction histidine kinase